MDDVSEATDFVSEELPKRVKDRVEKNRQRAIILRKSKLVSHPYAKGKTISVDTATIKIGATKYIDTGGGFLREEVEGEEEKKEPVQEEPPILEDDRPFCIKCDKPFAGSWLFDKFTFYCCDECKDLDEEHKLITRTDAMTQYLLKPVDLDKREPILKFITKKNPHNIRWGDMKLYLKPQVVKRALEVWGSEEAIEDHRKNREEKRVVSKAKKYQKQLKELRMNMRSSLYDYTSNVVHNHEFGPEKYNSDDDTYTRKCKTCPYEETFEKM